MNPLRSCLGVFAVLGRWPNWERYFDLSRSGLKVSLIILALCLVPLWLVAWSFQSERASLLETDFVPPDLLSYVLTVGLLLFSFPALAYLAAMIFEKMDRLRPWIITRNWSVFCLSVLTGAGYGLFLLGALPFAIANGIGFAAYMGVLAVDIRLAQKVAGFKLGAAILIACAIIGVGLTFVMMAMTS